MGEGEFVASDVVTALSKVAELLRNAVEDQKEMHKSLAELPNAHRIIVSEISALTKVISMGGGRK